MASFSSPGVLVLKKSSFYNNEVWKLIFILGPDPVKISHCWVATLCQFQPILSSYKVTRYLGADLIDFQRKVATLYQKAFMG